MGYTEFGGKAPYWLVLCEDFYDPIINRDCLADTFLDPGFVVEGINNFRFDRVSKRAHGVNNL